MSAGHTTAGARPDLAGRRTRLWRLCVASLAAGLQLTSAAHAQDVYAGKRIAQTWCSGCHRIDDRLPPIASDTVPPSFASIAQMNSTTEMSLTAFLSTPHAQMPDYALTHTEIENVSAYILSLRKPH